MNPNFAENAEKEDNYSLNIEESIAELLYSINNEDYVAWANMRRIIVINEENTNLSTRILEAIAALEADESEGEREAVEELAREDEGERERELEKEREDENDNEVHKEQADATTSYDPDPITGFEEPEQDAENGADNEPKSANPDDEIYKASLAKASRLALKRNNKSRDK